MSVDFSELGPNVVDDFSDPSTVFEWPATVVVNNRLVPGGIPVLVPGIKACVLPPTGDDVQSSAEGSRLSGNISVYTTATLRILDDSPPGQRGHLIAFQGKFYEVNGQLNWTKGGFNVYSAILTRESEGF